MASGEVKSFETLVDVEHAGLEVAPLVSSVADRPGRRHEVSADPGLGEVQTQALKHVVLILAIQLAQGAKRIILTASGPATASTLTRRD